jgi:Bacteriocin-protection, YdeI or OmpD-Associated/Domain of unknown function (DUF1905)
MTGQCYRFQATIYRIWMMRHVDVPDDVARELQAQMRTACRGSARGSPLKRPSPKDGTRRTPPKQAGNASGGPSARLAQRKQTRNADSAEAKGDSAQRKYIPVVAIVNGKLARTTLVPAGGGRFRMQINTALRKAARADVGDLVGVELRLDRESRDLPLPVDLRAGLKAHSKAWKAFQALAPGHRRHVIAWFDSAKSETARSRRLDRMVDFLLERALLGGDRRSRARKARRRAPKRATL